MSEAGFEIREILPSGKRCSGMSRDFDREYRAYHQETDNRLTRVTMVVVAIIAVAFIRADQALINDPDLLRTTVMVRAAFAAVCLAMFVGLRKLRDPLFSDIAILAWTMVLVGMMAWVATTRRPDYAGFLMTDVLVVMALFTTIRIPTSFQLIPALLLAILSVSRHTDMATPTQVPMPVVALAFGTAIALGAVASWQFDSSRYQQYRALLDARDLRTGLEEARGEIQALTEGRPVHAICPECLKKHEVQDL
jgi:nitrogen fixation-related uncharacterized protein